MFNVRRLYHQCFTPLSQISIHKAVTMMNQIFEAEHSERERSDSTSVSGEEPTITIYHPTTGEALNPDSIQYKVMYQFLNDEASTPTGPCQNNNLQEAPPLVKGHEGPLRTIHLTNYSRDSMATHRWTQITKGKVQCSMEFTRQGQTP